MKARTFIAPVLLIALVSTGAPFSSAQETPPKPNLLFILTDDQRADTMSVMPVTRAAFDVNFSNYVVTSPNCCPSRSSYLTGLYVHNTRVNGTTPRFYRRFKKLEPHSLGPWLQAQGYHTGFIGKYFNYVTRADSVPPGWDEFVTRIHGEGNATTEFTLRERFGDQDKFVAYPNSEFPNAYSTSVYGTKAQQFLQRAPNDKPVALFVWPNAPNSAGPQELYADAPLPPWKKLPSFMERDVRDKPSEIRKSPTVKRDPPFHRDVRASQLRQLMTVDDVVEVILTEFEAQDLRDNTWGVFTSDNGRFWGEHRLRSKVFAYDESSEVPFRMMIPGYQARSFTKLAANIDVAPTLVRLAGDRSRHDFNGRSLLPVIRRTTKSWRKEILIEHQQISRRYDSLRNSRWLYIYWPRTGHTELYNRRSDPYQLRNVARKHPRTVRLLHRRLRRLKAQ